MEDEDYKRKAVQVALAMAHQDYVIMMTKPHADLSGMSRETWARYDAWQQDCQPFKDHAHIGACIWIGTRSLSHLSQYFQIDQPEGLGLLAEVAHDDPRALDTVMTHLQTGHAVTPGTCDALALMQEGMARWLARHKL